MCASVKDQAMCNLIALLIGNAFVCLSICPLLVLRTLWWALSTRPLSHPSVSFPTRREVAASSPHHCIIVLVLDSLISSSYVQLTKPNCQVRMVCIDRCEC